MHNFPKGPFHTKNATMIEKTVNYYSRSVFTMPPIFTTLWSLL